MELLDKLSFNLSPARLEQWPQWLVDAYQLEVVWPAAPDTAVTYHSWRDELFIRPFARMKTVKYIIARLTSFSSARSSLNKPNGSRFS